MLLFTGTDKMVFTEETLDYFLLLQSRVRAAVTESRSETPYLYANESFFIAYDTLYQLWIKRKSQRHLIQLHSISRKTLKQWEENFITYGVLGLLPSLSFIDIDSKLEQLVVLIKSARPHETSSHAFRLSKALHINDATLKKIRLIQRCHGYGQRLDNRDIKFYEDLQRILYSVDKFKSASRNHRHDPENRKETFFNYDQDPFQQKVELFKRLSQCEKRRQIRSILEQFGIHPNRFYELRGRYFLYGIWGLVDIIHKPRSGEKISPELELKIIEERLMNPALSTQKMIKELDLQCSRANVQKIYSKWNLSSITEPVTLRGVRKIAIEDNESAVKLESCSARSRFPNLIEQAGLKVNRVFSEFLSYLRYKSVPISNPGAIITAPFVEQLGIVEALHTYGPKTFRGTEISNHILVNVLRIIVGFPTIHDFMLNSDRSVAIGSGLMGTPRKTRFYECFDDLRFLHLQKLRNDAALRAKELGVIEGKEIAIDYHCDPSDSRYPGDKSLSKAPDANGDLVYAHRPQIIWDSVTNSIINIAYCEGRSRAPSALYKFCEENLYKIIDRKAIEEIYMDSEYTGEKQIVYLVSHSDSHVTMCLKQNKRIKLWKEEVLKNAQWESYDRDHRITSQDFTLSESGRPFRFVVKQNINTNEIRCFGSTHISYTPRKILDCYHIRWSVENGIKDLIENYFLDKPTGTSPEKVECHYYCIMLARLTIDYFLSVFCEPRWKTEQEWECVLSSIRNTIFTNQNCKLSRNDSGNLRITYLDGDPLGIKNHLKSLMRKRLELNLNRVAWWGNIGVEIDIEDKYDLGSASQFKNI